MKREKVKQNFMVDNANGYRLDIDHFFDPSQLRPELPPIVMFPGYCMNTFILSYHPRGTSMVDYLTSAGYEVWTANLRGQGGTERTYGSREITFSDLAGVDIPAVFDHVHEETLTEREDVCAVGCSLGATFLYAYLAIHEQTPVTSVMSLGGPLRWTKVHPLIKTVFRSRRVARRVVLPGTRKLAQMFLPVALKVPSVLSIYMNTDKIDLSNAAILTQTVDDPIPSLNAEIVSWIQNKDLHVDGFNVTDEMSDIVAPLLQICANRDGIVPIETAMSAADAFGSRDITTVIAGNNDNWFAHADLFINDDAESLVFEPMVDWLRSVY